MPKLAFAVLAIGLCGSLGCNQIADINDPIPRGSATGPGLPPGSPPGTPPGGGDKSNFLGSWSGDLTVTVARCSDGADGTYPGHIILTVTESSNGVLLTDEAGCNVDFTVNGNVATAIAGAKCSFAHDNGITETLTTSVGSFTLSSGTSATLKLSGKETRTDGVSSAGCDFVQEGQLIRGGGN